MVRARPDFYSAPMDTEGLSAALSAPSIVAWFALLVVVFAVFVVLGLVQSLRRPSYDDEASNPPPSARRRAAHVSNPRSHHEEQQQVRRTQTDAR